MRRIHKNEPQFFTDFIAQHHPQNWGELHKDGVRQGMRKYMLGEDVEGDSEQNGICAYTEKCISSDNSHIDHFRKKDQFPSLTFDWDNLLVSCNDEDYGGKHKDNTHKVKPEDYEHIVNPVLEDFNDYVDISLTGKMFPKSSLTEGQRLRAEKTIKVFNLNNGALIEMRRVQAKQVQAMFSFLSVEDILATNKGFPSTIRSAYATFTVIS